MFKDSEILKYDCYGRIKENQRVSTWQTYLTTSVTILIFLREK
jgi:hypothetical protein